MTLTQDLINLRNQLVANHSDDIKATMNKATQDLLNSNIIEQTLKVGEQAPDFILPNVLNKAVELNEILQAGSVVISFYRGQWCPYCNLELRTLQQYLPRIKEQAATLVAISPQTPDNSLSTAEKNELTFEVLSDFGNQVARKFGLVFTLPEQLRPIYEGFEINLPAHNGDETYELPLAATYIINQRGKVIYCFVDSDYTKRLDPEVIIQTLSKGV